MVVIDIFIRVVMLLLGVIAGSAAVGLANFLGFPGWIAGLALILLALGYFYLSDKVRDAGMNPIMRVLTRYGAAEEERDIEEERRGRRFEYLSFLVGVVVGIAASLVWSPGAVIDLLPL
ncbi:hypothetical protein ACW9UR_22845 [Halovulum sp. GXIMD14794]